MIEKMTIGQVAEELDCTPATVRNWLKHFGDEYLSPDATKPTGKRFTPSDVATLRNIQRLLRDGKKYDEVPGKLPEILEGETEAPEDQPEVITDQQPFDVPEEEIFDRENAIQQITFFTDFIDRMGAQHEREIEDKDEQHKREIAAKDETIAAKDEQINELKQDKQRLQSEIDRKNSSWLDRLRRFF